jgi:hypothetical protein
MAAEPMHAPDYISNIEVRKCQSGSDLSEQNPVVISAN